MEGWFDLFVRLDFLLAPAVETETMVTWRGFLRIKLETCLVGVFVHWRKVSAAQAGHDVEPYLAYKGGDQGRDEFVDGGIKVVAVTILKGT